MRVLRPASKRMLDSPMTVRIDGTGRIVIPKPMREKLGLTPGTELEVSEGPDGLLSKPAQRDAPALVLEDGLLVHQGVPTEPLDFRRFIEQVRERRGDDPAPLCKRRAD